MPFTLGRRAVLFAALVAGLGIAVIVAAAAMSKSPKRAAAGLTATLKDATGRTVGTVRLTPGHRGRFEVRTRLRSLTPGFHGMHIHEAGVCQGDAKDAAGAPAPFFTAGGHLKSAPTQNHSDHAADMPPALVMRNGTAFARVVTDRLSVSDVLDANGSAVIVHLGADNLANIPTRYHSHTPDAASTTFGPDTATLATGDAGGRGACGVLRRAKT